MTSDDDMTIIEGSGNVFRDLGLPDPEVRQAKALLAAEIIKTLVERRLSVRAAHGVTGIAAADFSRIRNVNLGRFTIDRLISILGRLDREVEVSVSVRARPQGGAARSIAGIDAMRIPPDRTAANDAVADAGCDVVRGKPLPRLASEEEADTFVGSADLSDYDLSTLATTRFEFSARGYE